MHKLFLLFLLTGCGLEQPPQPHDLNKVVLLNSFSGYLNIFIDQADQHGVALDISALIIRFHDLVSTDKEIVLGMCTFQQGSAPSIMIDPTHWKDLSMVGRELLLFHELGHCLLKRDHTANDVVSIMNPFGISVIEYSMNEEGFLSELFDSSKFNSL